MSILSIMASFTTAQVVAVLLLALFTIVIWTIKYIVLNRLSIIDILVCLVILVISVISNTLDAWLIILLIVLSTLNLIYSVYDLIIAMYIKNICLEKTADYVKNNEYDFFIQMDEKERIINCSNTLLKLARLSKKEVLKIQGWKFIFDTFDVRTLNKEEFSLNNLNHFLKEFKECNSKHKLYKFTMEANLLDENKNSDIIRYDGIIQPIYFGNKVVGRNVYFYQDKFIVVEKLKDIVRSACTDLEDSSLQLDVMMSMSEGIVMYYDFQNRVFVATDCLCAYTKTNKKEYTFEELFSHIHPDDVQKYIEQAETVNSLAITKINYRLSIGGIYYKVEEDSIYLRKDYGLVSIIRIAERSVSQSVPQNAKVQKDIELLNKLADTSIMSTLDKTSKILDHVLGDNKNED